MMINKKKMIRILVRKNQAPKKRKMKIDVMIRMMIKMVLHLEKIAVRRVSFQLKNTTIMSNSHSTIHRGYSSANG